VKNYGGDGGNGSVSSSSIAAVTRATGTISTNFVIFG